MQETSPITVHIEESDSVLHIAGELSIATTGELRRALLTSLTSAPPAALDLAGVTAADLSGLQLLSSARKTWRTAGANLQLTGAPEWFRILAADAGYRTLFEPCPPEGA